MRDWAFSFVQAWAASWIASQGLAADGVFAGDAALLVRGVPSGR